MHGRRHRAADAGRVVVVNRDVFAAEAAAIHRAEVSQFDTRARRVADNHVGTVDVHLGILHHIAQLTAAIYTTIYTRVARDVHLRVAALGQARPQGVEVVCIIVVALTDVEQASHAAAEDVASCGVHDVGHDGLVPRVAGSQGCLEAP